MERSRPPRGDFLPLVHRSRAAADFLSLKAATDDTAAAAEREAEAARQRALMAPHPQSLLSYSTPRLGATPALPLQVRAMAAASEEEIVRIKADVAVLAADHHHHDDHDEEREARLAEQQV